MLFALLVTSISTSVEQCHADDGVCLLQFMKKEHMKKEHVKKEHGILKQGTDSPPMTLENLLNGGYDFDSLVKEAADGAEKVECPLGEPLFDVADAGLCSKEGADIVLSSDGIIDMNIAKFFGDNVAMKHFKYYVEDSTGNDIELIAPDINHHHFPVGMSEVKVVGFDLAGNSDYCYRTIYIHDTEPPTFSMPDSDVDGTTTVKVDDETCEVLASEVFHDYEISGWDPTATDNCDNTVEVVKKIFNEHGECVWDSRHDALTDVLPMGPGTYHIEYVAVDDYMTTVSPPLPTPPSQTLSLTTTHTVTLVFKDEAGPFNMTGCPSETIEYIIEAHETETQVTWTEPHVSGDNCGQEEEGYAVEQSTPQKFPGMTLPVGSHNVRYSLFDKYDNVMATECIFEVHIIQKAHPVTVTCPDDVEFNTVTDMHAGIVTWATPTATQGEEVLDASHIHYPQGVFSGMLFPFGVTTVLVNATGAQTGTRVDEHLMYDECTFVVTVNDPQPPLVDGQKYRCKSAVAEEIMPFRICDGPEVTTVLESTYMDTFGYETTGVVNRAGYSCCESEESTLHECVAVPGSTHNKYCKPV